MGVSIQATHGLRNERANFPDVRVGVQSIFLQKLVESRPSTGSPLTVHADPAIVSGNVFCTFA